MNTSVEDLIDTVEKDQKLISYLKTIYKEKTGEDPQMPKEKKDQEKILDIVETFPNQKFPTFKDKVISLNLPSSLDKNAKARIEKLRRAKDTSVLIKKLDISYFAGKEITVELMKRIIDGLKILKSVEVVNLSHNDLTDAYIDVIVDFFLLPNITSIDISFNKLTKECTKKLSQTIQACRKIQSLDVSYNPFNRDYYACMQICSSLKNCERLTHFGICDSSRDSGIRVLAARPTLYSLNLSDSTYRKKTYDTVARYISLKKYELKKLNLKFCTIDFIYGAQFLAKGLKKNRTLIELNLYGSGLSDVSGMTIIKSVIDNKYLKNLNLAANHLSTYFCDAFGEVLKTNETLSIVNISKNYKINDQNFTYVVEGLKNNQTIISLGDLIDMKIGVKYRESTEKILMLNKKFAENWKNTSLLKSQKLDFYNTNVNDEMEKSSRSMKLSLSSSLKPMATRYSKDINDIIEPLSPNKKNYNVFISNDSMNVNDNEKEAHESGKIIVPYSIQGTSYLKQKPKTKLDEAKKSSIKKSSSRSRTGFSSSRSKSKGKKVSIAKPKGNVLNTVASFIQEVIDRDPSLTMKQPEKEEKQTQEGLEYIRFSNNRRYVDPAAPSNALADVSDENIELSIEAQNEDEVKQKYGIDYLDENLDFAEERIFNIY